MEFGLCEKLLTLASLFFLSVSYYDSENGWLVGFKDPSRDTTLAARLLSNAAGLDTVALVMTIGHTLCELTDWYSTFHCETWPVSIMKLVGGSALLKAIGCCLFVWKVGAISPRLILCAISIVCGIMAFCILTFKDDMQGLE